MVVSITDSVYSLREFDDSIFDEYHVVFVLNNNCVI
jgi:hypothetical protein